MITRNEVVRVGKLQKLYGIRGEISLVFEHPAYADIETNFYILEIEGICVPFLLEEITFTSDTGARVKLEDINNESQASKLTNLSVFLLRKQVTDDLLENNSGWDAFIGYTLLDQHQHNLGVVEEIDSATLNVLFVTKKNDTEYLIPATDDFVVEIDDRKKIVRMNLPEGLIEA